MTISRTLPHACNSLGLNINLSNLHMGSFPSFIHEAQECQVTHTEPNSWKSPDRNSAFLSLNTASSLSLTHTDEKFSKTQEKKRIICADFTTYIANLKTELKKKKSLMFYESWPLSHMLPSHLYVILSFSSPLFPKWHHRGC